MATPQLNNYDVYYHTRGISWDNSMNTPYPAFDIRPRVTLQNGRYQVTSANGSNGWTKLTIPRLKYTLGDEKAEITINAGAVNNLNIRIIAIINNRTGLVRYYTVKDIKQMLDGGYILDCQLDMWLSYGYDFIYNNVYNETKLIADRSHVLNSYMYLNDITARLRYWQTLERVDWKLKDEVNLINYLDDNYFMTSENFSNNPTFKVTLHDRYTVAGGKNFGSDTTTYLYSDRTFAMDVYGTSLGFLSWKFDTLKTDGNYQTDYSGITTGSWSGGRPNTDKYFRSKADETNPFIALYGCTNNNDSNWLPAYSWSVSDLREAFQPNTNEWAIVNYKGYVTNFSNTSSKGKFRRANNSSIYMWRGTTLLAVPINDKNRNHFLSGRFSAICFGIFKTSIFGNPWDWPVFNSLLNQQNTNYQRCRAVAFIQDWTDAVIPKGSINYAGVVIYANWSRHWSGFSSSTTDEVDVKWIADNGESSVNNIHCNYYIKRPLESWEQKRTRIGMFYTNNSTPRAGRYLPQNRKGIISGNSYSPTNTTISTASSLAQARAFTASEGVKPSDVRAPFYLWNFLGLNRLGMVLNNEVIYYDWQINNNANAVVVSNFTGQDMVNIISPYQAEIPYKNWMTMNQSIVFQNQELKIDSKYYEYMQSQRNSWQTGLEQAKLNVSNAYNQATGGGLIGWTKQVISALTFDVSQIVNSVNAVNSAKLAEQYQAQGFLSDLWSSKVSVQQANNFYNNNLATSFFQVCLNIPSLGRLHNWINANGFDIISNNDTVLLNPNNFSPNWYPNQNNSSNVDVYKYGYIRYTSESVDWISHHWRTRYPALGQKYFDWCVNLLKNGIRLFAPNN